ncbi:MAG TPA: tRNA uracil 4-sulfurtransferase ThiI [Pseudomonadales bacterium]
MQLIVKLFPEITIKSSPVRRQMVRHLAQNLSRLIKPLDAAFRLERDWDKIIIHSTVTGPGACSRMVQLLTSTPGVAQVLEVEEFPLTDIDALAGHVLDVLGDALNGQRFAVRCKRAGRSHGFNSLEVERTVGAALVASGKTGRVDLTNPELTVRVEVRDDRVFVVKAKHRGLGGFPLGSVEPVLSLMSGGFDSAVSSFLTMKRGMRTHFLFFNLGGHAHEIAVKEVALYLWLRYGASHRVLFITVPFEGVVAEILERVNDSQMGVVLKRCMLRAAERIALELEVPALVTGESVAQVSSQTLTNLAVIDRVTPMLVLRPLIAMDKGDIIDIARRIGTEPFSRHMPEYCGVISKGPTTCAKLPRIEREEASMDAGVLEAAIAARRMVSIDALADDLKTPVAIPETAIIHQGDRVLDIRHPAECDVRPSGVADEQYLAIPFYELHRRVDELDRTQRYWLYCERGVMSRLHAGHLQEQGFTRAGVYRPE